MTDRIRTVTVVLDRDYRDDDVEAILNAIRMVRGVAHVETTAVTAADYSNRMAIAADCEVKVIDAVRSAFRGRNG